MALKKSKLASDANGQAIQGALSPFQVINVNYTDSSAKSAAIEAEVVRLIATSDCYVKFGDSDVAATSSDMLLKGSLAEYFTLGGRKYIAAIRVSSNGTLNITVVS
jgi:hypothetical protein